MKGQVRVMRVSPEKGQFEAHPKRIFLEPLWKLRQEYYALIQHPPEGYRFLVRETAVERAARKLAKASWAYTILLSLSKVLPMQLLKPWWERFKRVPDGVDLTYAVVHPVFRKESWVMDMCGEQPHLLVGNEAMFRRFRWLLRKLLASDCCRKVIYHVEIGKKALLTSLEAPELEDKVQVIYPAVPKKSFAKQNDNGPVRLLFVGSANIEAEGSFRAKGGFILVEAFLHLRQRFPDLELVIRSRVPPDVRKRCAGVTNLRLIEETLRWEELERGFIEADIFVCPAHMTPSITFVDAMSYHLPVVTTDVWSNPELVEDGRTGLLVHHPQAHRYIRNFVAHNDWPEFKEVINQVDARLVEGIVDKVAMLVQNPELRRQMGSAGGWEVEHGKFSLEKRNEKLKRILDEATS